MNDQAKMMRPIVFVVWLCPPITFFLYLVIWSTVLAFVAIIVYTLVFFGILLYIFLNKNKISWGWWETLTTILILIIHVAPCFSLIYNSDVFVVTLTLDSAGVVVYNAAKA